MNTYSSNQTFSLVSTNSNFILVDANDVEITELTANANSETVYTIYVKANPSAIFSENTESSLMQIYSYNAGYENVDTVNFDVEISAILDDIPPKIGNIVMAINDTVGRMDITWDRLDTGGTSITDGDGTFVYDGKNGNNWVFSRKQ